MPKKKTAEHPCIPCSHHGRTTYWLRPKTENCNFSIPQNSELASEGNVLLLLHIREGSLTFCHGSISMLPFSTQGRKDKTWYGYYSLQSAALFLTCKVHWKTASKIRGTSSIIVALYLREKKKRMNATNIIGRKQKRKWRILNKVSRRQ